MASIDPALIRRLQDKLRIGRAAVYKRIEKLVNSLHLDRRSAAIVLASQSGVNTARFATPEDRAAIREALRSGAGTQSVSVDTPAPVPSSKRRGVRRTTPRRPIGRRQETAVWVVHGRNLKAANEVRKFLRALELNPLEWNQAVARTRQASPYVGTVLEKAFDQAAAVVVLLTPDDEARLRARYRTPTDPGHETRLTPQPRANVLFEAGMAFGSDPKRAVLVQLGRVRPFSNIAGRHVVQLDGSPKSRLELATKLKNAGCRVNTEGEDWLSHGDFSQSDRGDPRRRPPRPRDKARKRRR